MRRDLINMGAKNRVGDTVQENIEQKQLYGGGSLMMENITLHKEIAKQQAEIKALEAKLAERKRAIRRFTKVMLNGYRSLVCGTLTLNQRGILQALPYLVQGYAASGRISFVSGEILVNPDTGASISSWRELGQCLNIPKSCLPRAKQRLQFLEEHGIINAVKDRNKINFYLKDTQYFCARAQ